MFILALMYFGNLCIFKSFLHLCVYICICVCISRSCPSFPWLGYLSLCFPQPAASLNIFIISKNVKSDISQNEEKEGESVVNMMGGENEHKMKILGRIEPDDGHWMQIISVILLQHQSSSPHCTEEQNIATSNALIMLFFYLVNSQYKQRRNLACKLVSTSFRTKNCKC